ncbi:MAG: RNA polymerase sigma factor RpoH [Gammaproteobacteria bacterium]|nr:RNA polymerase sigma factor RpoH [Gammaproteobacteria bacterium]
MTKSIMPAQTHFSVSTANVDSYIASAYQIPVLDAEQEHALAIRLHEDNDLDAARTLILHHLRFVVQVARGYNGYGLPIADLIQEGNVGLMKAVKKFDPHKGVRLVSFAVHWVRAEIHEYVLRNWRIVKIATTKAQRKLFFNLRSNKKRLAWLNQAEVENVAEQLGVKATDVLEMEKRLSSPDLGFDLPDHADEEDSAASYAPAAYLSEDTDTPEIIAEQNDWQAHQNKQLKIALQELDERSRYIIAKRWLAEEKTTLQDLAKEYDISAERVRQLENNAIKKLKSAVAA